MAHACRLQSLNANNALSAGRHYMTGPVYVCGAEPGDVLEVLPLGPVLFGRGETCCNCNCPLITRLLFNEQPAAFKEHCLFVQNV